MGRRLPRPTPETAQVVHQREAFLGALRGRSNVPIPVGRDANSLARSRAGGASASAVRAYQDEFVLAGGEEDVELTYLPLTYSEHTYLNGVYQREGDDYDWTRESGTRTVTVKAAMDARAGDVLIVEYLYYAGTPTQPEGRGEAAFVAAAGLSEAVTPTPALPVGVQDGDLLLLFISNKQASVPTVTGGWSLVASAHATTENARATVYSLIYDSSTYSTPSVDASGGQAGILAWRNGSVGQTETYASNVVSKSLVVPAIDVTTGGTTYVVVFSVLSDDSTLVATNSTLTDFTSVYVEAHPAAQVGCGLYYGTLSGAGSSGDFNYPGPTIEDGTHASVKLTVI